MHIFEYVLAVSFWAVWIFTCPLVGTCQDCKLKK
jgi:hypothetical protein